MKASKISDLLGKINRAIENPAFPAISKIELDLLKQHLRDVYDEIEALAANSNPAIIKATVVTEAAQKQVQSEEAVVVKRPVMHTNSNILLDENPAVEKIIPPVIEKVIAVIKETPAKEVQTIEKTEVKVQKAVVQTPVASINESIKSGGSLNEKLKSSSAIEMHKKLASKPLKELIDLNKRFVLLSELFKGNTDAYTSAITHIDTLPDYDSAQHFISTQLASNYYWDETKQSTRMFTKLVKLKYGIE